MIGCADVFNFFINVLLMKKSLNAFAQKFCPGISRFFVIFIFAYIFHALFSLDTQEPNIHELYYRDWRTGQYTH